AEPTRFGATPARMRNVVCALAALLAGALAADLAIAQTPAPAQAPAAGRSSQSPDWLRGRWTSADPRSCDTNSMEIGADYVAVIASPFPTGRAAAAFATAGDVVTIAFGQTLQPGQISISGLDYGAAARRERVSVHRGSRPGVPRISSSAR